MYPTQHTDLTRQLGCQLKLQLVYIKFGSLWPIGCKSLISDHYFVPVDPFATSSLNIYMYVTLMSSWSILAAKNIYT